MSALFVVKAYPALLTAFAAAWAALMAFSAPRLRALLPPLTRPAAAVWAAALALLVARAALIAPAHRVFWDEIEHAHLAQNLSRLNGFAQSVIGGRPERDELRAAGHWPPLFHLIVGSWGRVAGFTDRRAFEVNAALGLAGPPLFGLAVAAAASSAGAGALATLLLAGAPLHAKYAASGDLTALSVLMGALTLLASAAAARAPEDRPLRALALATALLAAHARPENALLLALPFALRGTAPSAAELLGALSGLAPLAALIVLNREDDAANYATAGANLLRNLPANLRELIQSNPPLALLSAYGLAAERRFGERRLTRVLAGWFAVFLAVTSAHRLGEYWRHDVDRLAFGPLLPMIAAAACAAKAMSRPVLAAAAAACLAAGACRLPSLLRVRPDEAAKEALLRVLPAHVPEDAYVITFSPAAVNAYSLRPAVSVRKVLESPGILRELTTAPSGERTPLFLFEDFWRHDRPLESAALTRALADDYRTVPSLERSIGGQTYSLKRLVPKSGLMR